MYRNRVNKVGGVFEERSELNALSMFDTIADAGCYKSSLQLVQKLY